ncbi:two-component sensor histidine kinase [Dactylosporangium aurantiacum]|uniref:histidine kinase n=1 Tax=Dactylosporangium aurantiacum TaxID=35754 RepID=A0A9Q9IKB1_9ACTN|nr:histidine kinase [Dactylosporangium aurantiacum]MDG6103231.1 histidine kinase [Dactylosporangium aurantiacum]UWZ57734.1 two-component sensor histidine kinase [Dactylosporangium aurantiacum]
MRLLQRRDVADGVLVLACLALTALAVRASWSVLPAPVIAAAGVAGAGAQWWRRRLPWLAAVAGAAAYPLSGNPGPLLVGVYSGAVHGSRRGAAGAGVAGWAGIAGWSWVDEGRLDADDVVFSAVGAVLVTGLGLYVAALRELRASWQERAERADTERLLRDEQARAAERNRIAREMHDVLAHKVSLIALHAGALEVTTDTTRFQQGAGLIRGTAREALQDLRTVLGVLQASPPAASSPPPVPSGQPAAPDDGFADLPALVLAATRAGQRVELRDLAGPLPAGTARVVYRVAQEGLTNARKHAPGAPVTVTVERDPAGAVAVTVANPAGGAALDLPGSGAGLVGLAERVRLAGGTLRSGPAGGGWRLAAVVPWQEATAR